MISTNQFKNGMTIELDEILYTIISFQHVKPGKGGAFVRTKLKNVKTGAVIDKTFRAGEKVEQARLESKKMQFLYNDQDMYHFMDTQIYEQIVLSKEQLSEVLLYLKENTEVVVSMYEGNPIGVELPIFVELEVIETEPGVKGDTVSGGSKSAILETGASAQVPLFVNVGDIIKVDTRTGGYITRV
ncbi:elongation factor P [Candidatus Oleimmundimicrobium sp.]|uniref:elongation factor P n=1 Tax=Candidatus Oleimmundimicrobium sp. TaxID=3060597 RepID=UPI0027163D27|nr:elongation factor P [Candidatus Oleimmundimicrobium sp.]MDO8886515.1 elongation factor P [Candidatus Oleimmundimicrobium sp.]